MCNVGAFYVKLIGVVAVMVVVMGEDDGGIVVWYDGMEKRGRM